jgi:UDP-N-acetylglucosamine--N-acetylmuramyl-(pentapeptide) pyrophosphoryl-undecaprenol N-acetylglucosamine transferase
MKILFTGGGTGGHVIPIIAVARETRRLYPGEDLQFFYVGPKDDFGSILLSQEEVKVKHVLAGKVRRYIGFQGLFLNLIDVCFKIPIGIIQSFFYLFFLSPDVIFSKGGFGSIPGVIAGKILLAPVFLHESDITPGLANRFLSKFALEILVSFPVSKTEYFSTKKMVSVGNPIRKEVLMGSRERAKKFFELKSQKPVILVLGGSQGAQRINDKILNTLPQLLNNFEIIHQCGDSNFKQVQAESRVVINKEMEESYHLFPFLKEPELALAYAAADFVVSRAGSGIIFEIAAAGKPSILIPLPEAAQNHQVKNAYAYAEEGASVVVEEENFTSRFFLEKLKYLFERPAELERMAKAAKEFSRPEAAKEVADRLMNYLKQKS